MTVPVLQTADTQSGSQTSDSTSWSLTYPTNIVRGDLLLAVQTNDGGAGATWPADWQPVAAGSSPGPASRTNCAVKSALGTETGNFTVTLSVAEQGVWVVYRITSWYGCVGSINFGGGWNISVGGADTAEGGAAQGTSTAPNSTTINPGAWGANDVMWVAVCGFDGAAVATGFPSGYSNTLAQSSGGAEGAGHAIAFKTGNAATDDPGAFTLDISEEWAAWAFAIRGDIQPERYPKLVGLSSVTTGGTASANASVLLPTVIEADDLIVVLHRSATSTAGHGYPGGWTELFDDNSDGSDDRTSCAWKKADGSEGNTSITITQDNVKYASIVMVFRAAADPATAPPQFATLVTGTSTTPNPGSITPSWGSQKYLMVWAGGWEGEQTSPPANEPTNYTSRLGSNSGTAGAITTNVRVAVAFRWIEASSEDPPSWTISVSDDWTATTIAIRPLTDFVDAATVYLKLTPSGVDEHQTATVDRFIPPPIIIPNVPIQDRSRW